MMAASSVHREQVREWDSVQVSDYRRHVQVHVYMYIYMYIHVHVCKMVTEPAGLGGMGTCAIYGAGVTHSLTTLWGKAGQGRLGFSHGRTDGISSSPSLSSTATDTYTHIMSQSLY